MSSGSRLRMPMRVQGVLQRLPGLLVSREVILLPILLGDTMGVRGGIVQFGGPLMVLVMRSVVVTSRHNLHSPPLFETYDPARFVVGFLGELVRLIGVLQRPFRMPAAPFVISFFIVFGSSTMGVSRKFVLLGGFPVCVSHG